MRAADRQGAGPRLCFRSVTGKEQAWEDRQEFCQKGKAAQKGR